MKLVAGADPGMIQFEIRPLDRVPGFNYHTRISLRIHQQEKERSPQLCDLSGKHNSVACRYSFSRPRSFLLVPAYPCRLSKN